MRLRLLAPLVALSCASLFAHADTVSVFNVTNQSGSLLGTVTINETSGLYTNIDLSLDVKGVTETFDATPTQTLNRDLDEYQATVVAGGDELLFELPGVLSLAGYTPADLKGCKNNAVKCDFSADVYNGPISSADLADTLEGNLSLGSTSTTGVTPEPSSIALLGTGLLGVAGVIRRRLA